jgi:hypothetical protein
VQEYGVESYLGRGHGDDFVAVARRARAAAAALAREGLGVRWLRSSFVGEDELCLHWFTAPSEEAVRTAAERAEIPCDRVVAADTVEGEGT